MARNTGRKTRAQRARAQAEQLLSKQRDEELGRAALGDIEAAWRYRELAARTKDPERRADYLAAAEASVESGRRHFLEGLDGARLPLGGGGITQQQYEGLARAAELKRAALGDVEAVKRYRDLATRAEDPKRRADYLAAALASNESAQRNFREASSALRLARCRGDIKQQCEELKRALGDVEATRRDRDLAARAESQRNPKG
jgi:hypothetical protein